MAARRVPSARPRSQTPDILNDFLAGGGSISFHSGECFRKFLANNKISEEGLWDATDGSGVSYRIPYKFVAVMGEPVLVRLEARKKGGRR